MKRLFNNNLSKILIIFTILYLLKYVLPQSFMLEVIILSIYTMGCSFLIGRVGFVSFGQPAYLAIGAYGTAFYLYYFGTNPFVAILVGILLGLIINIITGAFFIRLNSSYYTLCNQAFCVVNFFIFQKALVKYTHGDNGLWFLSRIDPTPVIDLSRTEGVFIFAFLVAVGVWLLFNYLMNHSVFGATCLCVKCNEEKLRFLGYNVFNIKWLAFIIANTITSLAGALYSLYFGFVSAGITAPSKAIEPVAISMLGGAGTLFGPLVGSFIFIGLKDIASQVISYWELLVGLMLIIVMLAGEKGIVGSLEGFLSKLINKHGNNEGLQATNIEGEVGSE
jgi:branched-chain amino acid transport system permease protein